MKIGYARVSTQEQNLDLQRDALTAAGCARIVEDTASGDRKDRAGLERVREQLREGQGVGFQSITEAIDTTTPGGKLVFHIFGALAEFERNLIRERTKAGLEAARARGRKGGRKKKLDATKRKLAVDLYQGKKHTISEICRTVGISKPTLYAYVGEHSHAPRE